MPIKRFKFSDHAKDWHLESTEFGDFNLLVGASGVGKSFILRALESALNTLHRPSFEVDGAHCAEWEMVIATAEGEYTWSARTTSPADPAPASEPFFKKELELYPSGMVVVVDEIENSPGMNCLPELLDRYMSASGDKQFILTTHSPYVINNVPAEYFKIVTREGNRVRVHDSLEFPQLCTCTSFDRYALLQSLDEYANGIR